MHKLSKNFPKVVIIPVRGINTAMSTLRKSLDNDMISSIVKMLLMNAISNVQQLDRNPIILTADKKLASELNSKGINSIIDNGKSLNNAIRSGILALDQDKFALIMPDLPGINKANLSKLIHLSNLYPNIIAPTLDNGTAFAILPKNFFEALLFGPQSSTNFIDLANKRSIPLAVIEINGLQRDLDTYEDWIYWKKQIQEMLNYPEPRL